MKLIIEIPEEFVQDFKRDKFKESFSRAVVDSEQGGLLVGNYEREVFDMFSKALQKAEVMEVDS